MNRHFENYIHKMEKNNLHPKINKLIKTFPETIGELNNIIIYGSENIGKYTQALNIISRYSPSKLKYEKRVVITKERDENYILKMSDIHFEVDMFLLGCNSKTLWYSIYHHISDIISQKLKHGIILCKNFHLIQNELLDVFYSYMQNNFSSINISFILITEELSFIPNNITECCEVIHIPKPYKTNINKCRKKNNSNDLQKTVIKALLDTELNYVKIRNALYDIFIYQINIYHCLWIIYRHMKIKNIKLAFEYLILFFHRYNNNYRHIYHIELLYHQLLNIRY